MRRKGRIFHRVGGGGVGPVIAYDGGSWAKRLRGEGVEKSGKERGALAGSDKGGDGWGDLHNSMMEVLIGDGRPKIGEVLRVRVGAQVGHKR